MSEKTVDALKMKREGAERIYRRTKKMSRAEEVAYWTVRNESLRAENSPGSHRGKSRRKAG